ncbi:hypothetical protein [Bacillus solisilvae]
MKTEEVRVLLKDNEQREQEKQRRKRAFDGQSEERRGNPSSFLCKLFKE